MNIDKKKLGRAVDNGFVRFLSVSALKLFDPESEGCHRKWWFRYVAGKKEIATKSKERGNDATKALEHYLKTGEMQLPPRLFAGIHLLPKPGADLEVEEPLGDILKAVALRDEWHREPFAGDRRSLIEDVAGLAVNGIPIIGAADFRHRRGEYVDSDGNLRKEDDRFGFVAEIGDHKTANRIAPTRTKNGILPCYVKTPSELSVDVQMLGYAVNEGNKHPIDNVRLSHVNYAMTGAKGAKKVTTLISIREARERFARMDGVAKEIEQVATAVKVEDVEPTFSSCDAFTYKDPDGITHRGCMHRTYCPMSSSQAVSNLMAVIGSDDDEETSEMTLFHAPPPPPNGVTTPPPVPLDDAAHAAATAAEKEKLLAQVGAFGTCKDCGQVLTAAVVSVLRDKTVKHLGCSNAPAAGSPAPPRNDAVVPPDAPQLSFIEAASPPPPDVMAEIMNPEVKARAEALAVEHAARDLAAAQATAQAKEGTTHRCPKGKQRIVLTMDMALSRKMTCECGKLVKLKPAKEGDQYVATIPGHNVPKPGEKEEGESVPPSSPAPVAVAPPPPPPETPTLLPPPAPPPPSVAPPSPPLPEEALTNGNVLLSAKEIEVLRGLFCDRVALFGDMLGPSTKELLHRLRLL